MYFSLKQPQIKLNIIKSVVMLLPPLSFCLSDLQKSSYQAASSLLNTPETPSSLQDLRKVSKIKNKNIHYHGQITNVSPSTVSPL